MFIKTLSKRLRIFLVSAKDSFQGRERLKNKTIPIRSIGTMKKRGFIFITDLTKPKRLLIIFIAFTFFELTFDLNLPKFNLEVRVYLFKLKRLLEHIYLIYFHCPFLDIFKTFTICDLVGFLCLVLLFLHPCLVFTYHSACL